MGLLDALLSGGAAGGGLLDFLRGNSVNQQPAIPLAPDQAQYGGAPSLNAMAQAPIFQTASPSPQQNAQSGPLDNAQWPSGPIGAPSQANAQMVPQQPPPVIGAQPVQGAQPLGPGVGDRLMAGLQSFGNGSVLNGIQGLASGQRADPAGIAQQELAQVQNKTQRWLEQRGVDPITAQAAIGNPKVMESLLKQFEPKSFQFAGEGYVFDPKTGQGKRIYTPEDKTPTSVLEYQFYKNNVPQGQQALPFNTWLQTKDADPNKINTLGRDGELWKRGPDGEPIILHKNQPEPGAKLDDDTLTSMAGQYLSGDKSVFTNIGRGAQGAENIIRLRQRVKEVADAQGMKPADVAHRIAEFSGDMASQRTLGVRQTNADMAVTEAQKMSDLALAASQNVPRSNYPKVNQAIQAYRENTGDPNVMRFGAANLAFVNTYARAISPTGTPTVHDKIAAVAEGKLSTANSHTQYAAIVDQMRQEMAAAKAAPAQVKQDLRDAAAGRHAPASAASQGSGADAMLAHAREALAQGAPRAAVLQRLQQAGIDASGL